MVNMEISNDLEEVIALHNAVEQQNEDEIRRLLLKKVNINGVDKYIKSALHIAVACKNIKIVFMLLEAGANPNLKEKRQGMTALHFAIKERDIPIARLLLENGANPNEVTKYNSTALHLALQVQDEELVKLTLDYGANINAKKFGKSSLHLATEHNNKSIAAELIRRGCNVNDNCIDGQTALHIAVEIKDAEMVELLLQNNARTDLKKFGRSPLYLAVQHNCIDIVKMLLNNSLNSSNDDVKNRTTALELAFRNKNKQIVQLFIELGVDPNIRMSNKTPLHLASELEWEDVIKLLLEKKADVLAVTTDNMSPLHIALEMKNVRIAELLLEHGICVNARQHRIGITPLHIAVNNGCHKIVRQLLIAGAKPNVPTNLNITPLHLALEARDQEMIQILLAYGSNPNLPKYGKSPLEIAIECRWIDLVRELLERGADPNSIGMDQVSMIFTVIKQKNLELLKILIEFKADVNTPDPKTQYSPLQMIAHYRWDEAAEVLLENGADLNYTTADGTTALHLALERRREALVKTLLKKGASLDIKKRSLAPLHVAAESRWLEVSDIMLSQGADVNEPTIYMATPLFYAVEKNEFKMAQLFLQHGAHVDYKWYGSTALHQAARLGHADMINLLLDWGAQINEVSEQDKEHVTALHIALKKGDEQVSKILIERHANVKMRDNIMGYTPLHMAAESGCLEVAKMLLNRGVRVNEKDRFFVTPLELAVKRGRIRMAELLLDHGAKVHFRNRWDKYTCLHYSVVNGFYNMTRLLLAEGAKIHCNFCNTKTPFGLALQKCEDERMLNLLLLHEDIKPEVTKQILQQLGKITSHFNIGEMLVRHLVRRHGRIPSSKFTAFNICSNLENYHNKCVAEMEQLQNTVFYNNVTFYNLLKKSSQELSLYASNTSLVLAFKNSNYRTMFPIYENILTDLMDSARQLCRRLAGAESMIARLFRRELPHLLNHMILRHLDNTDLRILNSMNSELQRIESNKQQD